MDASLRNGGPAMQICVRIIAGRGNSRGKGPEAGTFLRCLDNRRSVDNRESSGR